MIKAGLEVKVVSLPAGDDPADFLIKKGKESFQSLIDNALTLIDYKLKLLYSKHGLHNMEGKVKIVKEILPSLKAIDNEIELRAQIKKISEALQLSEEGILIELRRQKKGYRDSSYTLRKIKSEPGNVKSEQILLGCMLENKDIALKVLKELELEDFTIPFHREILANIKKKMEEQGEVKSQTIIDSLNDEKTTSFISKILMDDTITFDEKVISGYISTIKRHKSLQEKKVLEKKAKLLDEKIKESEKIEEKDLAELRDILNQLKLMN